MNTENSKLWKRVKKKCGLTDSEVSMAIKLNLTPEKVMKMIPAKNEQWKDVPALRIRRLYEKKFGHDA